MISNVIETSIGNSVGHMINNAVDPDVVHAVGDAVSVVDQRVFSSSGFAVRAAVHDATYNLLHDKSASS